MARINTQLVYVLVIILVLSYAYQCSVTYRVIKQEPNKTEAAIDIREPALYWSLVLRYSNRVRLKVNNGGNIISSSPEGKIYIIAGNPIQPGTNLTVDFTSKYDKKPGAKLISATYNGRAIKVL
ncbi:unnamed protein product [Medioppia subpectinata]|uniref:Uncharacterized protein n=1 Tax=Medioppia subpectinata TaxID=1979941 RepID=A0A7R9L482_9ACAR|nr:unnamed protein product [Medioppia subpectinata]CAG2115100.1 unnamed protein product [Medioppia subpectinata]